MAEESRCVSCGCRCEDLGGGLPVCESCQALVRIWAKMELYESTPVGWEERQVPVEMSADALAEAGKVAWRISREPQRVIALGYYDPIEFETLPDDRQEFRRLLAAKLQAVGDELMRAWEKRNAG